MRVRTIVSIVISATLVFGIAVAAILTLSLRQHHGKLGEGEFIGQVRIEDEIGSSLGVLEEIRKLREDGARGVILRVDSPGGSVAASQEIFEAVKDLRADSIPVVVSMGNLAASGGLYCSLSAEKIFANPGTITGSIGVISQFPEAAELMKKLGIGMTTIKSGVNKDLGNPFRKADSGQIKVMHAVIMNAYEQFVQAILKNRPLVKENELRAVADGRVMTGEMAHDLGIVDTLGTYDDAVSWIKSRAGLSPDAEVREARPPKSFVDRILAEPANELKDVIKPKTKGLWYVYAP